MIKDPFFAEIDFEALERKELLPPTILQKENTARKSIAEIKKKKKDKEEQDMLFQEPVSTTSVVDELERGGEL